MVMFLIRHPMVFTFLNLFVLLKCPVMSMALITRNKVLTAKLLKQGYRYHKLREAFSKFYRRHFDLVSKYYVGLKTRLQQVFSESEFYGDLVYKFRKIIGEFSLSFQEDNCSLYKD